MAQKRGEKKMMAQLLNMAREKGEGWLRRVMEEEMLRDANGKEPRRSTRTGKGTHAARQAPGNLQGFEEDEGSRPKKRKRPAPVRPPAPDDSIERSPQPAVHSPPRPPAPPQQPSIPLPLAPAPPQLPAHPHPATIAQPLPPAPQPPLHFPVSQPQVPAAQPSGGVRMGAYKGSVGATINRPAHEAGNTTISDITG